MRFFGQTNQTNCSEIIKNFTSSFCHHFLKYGVLPNLLGDEDITDFLLVLASLCEARYDSLCYQHSREFLCYFFVPKCDPVSKQIIHLCKEMCHDFLKGCNFWKYVDCDYLPLLNGDIPCVYLPVRCNEPPTVRNAKVVTYYKTKGEYSLPTTAEYFCKEGFKMKRKRSIRCMPNAQWSTPPKCLITSLKHARSPFRSKLFVTILL